MTSRATKVDQTAFRQNENRVAVRERIHVHLRLDFHFFRVAFVQHFHLDFAVEVANIADNRLVLHHAHVLQRDHVQVTGRRHVDVAASQGLFNGGHFVTFHRSLQSIDRIDLSDHNTSAQATQGLRRTLTHVAITANHANLARHHHIGRALDAVCQRFAAAVQVIELRLRYRVVHIDRRDQQRTGFMHLVETVDAGGCFLRNTLPVGHHTVPAYRIPGMHFA